MLDQPKTFSDFMRDVDGEYSEARVMKTVDELIREGRSLNRIAYALLRCARHVSLKQSDLQLHFYFLEDMEKIAKRCMANIDRLVEEADRAGELPKA